MKHWLRRFLCWIGACDFVVERNPKDKRVYKYCKHCYHKTNKIRYEEWVEFHQMEKYGRVI